MSKNAAMPKNDLILRESNEFLRSNLVSSTGYQILSPLKSPRATTYGAGGFGLGNYPAWHDSQKPRITIKNITLEDDEGFVGLKK